MKSSKWRKILLGDIIDSISIKHKFDKESLIFLNTSDVLDGKVLNKNYMKVKEMPGQAKKSIMKGDILFSEIRPKNKRFAYVDFNSDDYVVSTKLMVLRKKSNIIDNRYLYKYLTSDKMLNYLQMIAEGRSGTFPQITFNELKNLSLNLPSLEEQKAIAKILSDLDEKIEVNNKINKNLEEMAQAIFKQWFVDFEFPNEEGKPYKSSGGEMVESELGMIPKGWSINKISEISEIKNGVNYSRNQEGELVKVINVRDFNGSLIVNDNSLDNIYLQQKQIDDYKLKKFDTVIVRSAKPGETILVDNDEIKVYSGFTIRVRTKKQSNKLYIFYCLRNSMKKIENSSNGTIFKNLNQRILGALNFAMPSEKILLKYNNLSEIIIEQISMKTKENERLEKLRDTLLPKLMSGEIRVPLENSEN
ncbi:restriction endonuclease subunit S [Clostridium perfringens]|uniref:restriction endonuclease subunit S n=1 Tax=Clostridium perfringens TaxID=1502 RepID=UPI002FCD6280